MLVIFFKQIASKINGFHVNFDNKISNLYLGMIGYALTGYFFDKLLTMHNSHLRLILYGMLFILYF